MDYRRLSNRLIVALIVTLALYLTSCRSSRTMTAETRSETHNERVLTQDRDSIFIHDSIFVYVGGDTVVRERWRTMWRERTVHDTVIERQMDTIFKTETVEKVVTKTSEAGKVGWIVALALFSIILIYILIKILLKTH